jgi:hypothetical protein
MPFQPSDVPGPDLRLQLRLNLGQHLRVQLMEYRRFLQERVHSRKRRRHDSDPRTKPDEMSISVTLYTEVLPANDERFKLLAEQGATHLSKTIGLVGGTNCRTNCGTNCDFEVLSGQASFSNPVS